MEGGIEYLDRFNHATRGNRNGWILDMDNWFSANKARNQLVEQYSWAVPTEPALELIADHSPIFEMGAGTGYWAYELRRRGVQVEAYDKYPPHRRHNHYHEKVKKVWTGVLYGRPPKAKRRPRHTLFLCWPPYREPMAYDTLRAYQGDTFIYVGESQYGCTGCGKFHELVASEWHELEWMKLPQWPGIHDGLSVYRRK